MKAVNDVISETEHAQWSRNMFGDHTRMRLSNSLEFSTKFKLNKSNK